MSAISQPIIQRTGELRATFLVTLSATLYGFLGFFGASLLNLNLPITSMLFWRFAIATLWMLIGIRKQCFNVNQNTKPSSLIFFVMSSICYCIACTFYFMASKLTGTGIAMVIYFAFPVFVVLLVMLQERRWIDRHTLVSILIILLGLFLLKRNTEGESLSRLGIVFALASALFYAFYVYSSKFVSHTLSSNLLTLVVCSINAVVFLIFSLITNSFVFPTTAKMWIFIFGLGIIATALPVKLMLEGLKTISASKASILSALEPVVTLFVGISLLNEEVTHLQIVGAMVILFSAIYIQFVKKNSEIIPAQTETHQ